MGGILTALIGSFAPAAGAFESIATVTAAGGETSLSFTSIPSTYKSLQIRGISRATAINASELYIKLNGVNGYTKHGLQGDGSSAGANGSTSNTNASLSFAITGSNHLANTFGFCIIDIIDYASTTKNKTIRSVGGRDLNGSGLIGLSSALATGLTTAAITSIAFSNDATAFAAGSTFSLYGIKG